VARASGFPKKARLRRRSEFLRVQQHGRRQHGALVVLIRMQRNGASGSRVGITASKRVGNAVVRNRVRRLIREVLRLRRLPPGLDFVVIAKPDARIATFQGMREDMDKLLSVQGIS
jgi:ribonuclease P protein component